ncbi:MAG: helix-turn-helix transcriptional regulator [Saprospiraceae bacterium]|uniref:Helix-turn-helix transcriptional regulator n=1 Tax=Candidatus Opimibacter skivensis TaxID=2982028 RepID=A0A9D7XRQ9_9BACT|nr:helix-turn-helix transcriptional regulator [Candidatus Opimibacter skivensis]
MAFSKARLYSRKGRITAKFFKTFGHPARQLVILYLASYGPSAVEIFSRDHPISSSSMSDHLEQLRELSLISYKEKHPYIVYELEWERINRAKKYILDFFDELEKIKNKQRKST